MTNLINNYIVSVQRNLPTILEMIILQIRPHQPGGWLHHLPERVGLGGHHRGTVVQPQRALVISADHQTDPLVTAQVHVKIVSVGPLEIGQHGHLLLYDLVLLGLLSQGLGSSLK